MLATYRLADPKLAERALPAILASQYGKGRVVYFAAAVDKALDDGRAQLTAAKQALV